MLFNCLVPGQGPGRPLLPLGSLCQHRVPPSSLGVVQDQLRPHLHPLRGRVSHALATDQVPVVAVISEGLRRRQAVLCQEGHDKVHHESSADAREHRGQREVGRKGPEGGWQMVGGEQIPVEWICIW